MRPILLFTLLLFIYSCVNKSNSSPTPIHETVCDTALSARQAKVLHDSFLACYGREEYEKSIKILQDEAILLKCLNNTEKLASCYYNRGLIYDLLDKDSVIYYYQSAFELDSTTYYVPLELGNIYQNQGDYEMALYYFKIALKNAVASRDTIGEVDLYVSLCNVFCDKKEFNKALINAEQGVRLIKDNDILWLNKGNALKGLQKYDKAREAYLQSLKFTEDDSLTESTCLTNIGITYKYEKNYTKAAEYLKQGLNFKIDKEGFAASYNNLADIFLLQNRLDSAFYYYQKAVTTILPDFKNNDWKTNPDTVLFKNALSKPDLMGYLRDKANAIKDTDPQRAIETYQLADHACDLIRHNSSEMQSKFFWREEAYPLYWQAVKLCYKLGKIEMAYYFFEKSRAIMLLEELNKRTADFQDKTQKAALTTLPTLQQNLNANQAFIEYLTPDIADEKMKDSVFALIVHKNKIELKRLYCPIAELDDFIRNKQGKPDDSYAILYHLWYQRLFEPLGIDQSTKCLAISGSGLLNSVSFESLLKMPEFRKENFLLYDYAVSYAYSATLKYESFTVQHPSKNLLGVAPIDFGRFNLPKLETTQAQLEKVLEIEPGEQLQSSAATKRAFLSLAPKYRYLQIFTHATEYDSIYSHEPAIYFADSVLSLSELYKQHFNADLAVLTACQTNRGQERLGEGSNSLARGFAFAGVPATVASLWFIPEKSASELTVAFYENINKGQSKDEALQNAKLSSINGSDGLNPYFWAGMVLIGNTDSVSNSPFNLWYVIGLGVVGAFIAWLFLSKIKKAPR